MADGGFDPCECIMSHDAAMRRLLSLLRNSQSYCTDTECFQDGIVPSAQATGGDFSMIMVAIVWVAVALALYALRPPSMRDRGDGKPSRDTDPGNPPPDASVN